MPLMGLVALTLTLYLFIALEILTQHIAVQFQFLMPLVQLEVLQTNLLMRCEFMGAAGIFIVLVKPEVIMVAIVTFFGLLQLQPQYFSVTHIARMVDL